VSEPPPLPDELRRLGTLHALGLLDTPAEERFDRITRMAQRLFDAPIALISLVDEHRQWFKSRQGLEATETPRTVSFCGHAIQGDDPMVVVDAADDPRFADNPLVVQDPGIRFYAGCPIAAADGSKLGTLCVIGREPRTFSESDTALLRDLADMVEREIAAADAAITDPLTGLTNRRGFQLIADKVLAVCERRSLPAVLVYVDLDDLKLVNDTFGHEGGDRVITDTAGLLATTFRVSDVVARLGGDEFATLLSATDDPGPPLERLRQLIAEHNDGAPPGQALSLSAGAAVFDPRHPLGIGDLTRMADEAMYRDKRIRKQAPRQQPRRPPDRQA
jgi:diguanylate cyclase (GGDEF)-like protein